MNILVTGGAGYIGSHSVHHLLAFGHSVVVLDDLSFGHRKSVPYSVPFYRSAIDNDRIVSKIVKDHAIDAVMHFAAFTDISESVKNPDKYWKNNFLSTLVLLKTVVENGIKKFIFSSSAAVYGYPIDVPITEIHSQNPTNPYGQSKLKVEAAIADFSKSDGLGYAILRYFNVAGADPKANLGEDHRPETHLIPKILLASVNRNTITLPLYGMDYPTLDGTCIRDYIHVQDLVSANRLALEAIQLGKGGIYNLGNGKGYSNLEVIQTCQRVTGTTIQVKMENRRIGDPTTLVACNQKIKNELGWLPKYPDLQTIIEHAWKWHSSHPNGYTA